MAADRIEACDETGKYVRVCRAPGLEARVAGLATRQHAVFSLDQLRQLGLRDSAIHKRAAIDRLHRIHRGVYGIAPRALLSREGHWMAAVLACGPDAVLSHRSAAALHGLRSSGSSRIDVTVPRRTRQKPGLRTHSSKTLTRADITTVNGIRCTTVARTLLDMAGVIDRRQLERALDQAEILHVFDLTAIDEQIARHPTRRGAKKLQAILEEHYVGSTPTWNDFEEAFLALTRRSGLPDPECNLLLDLHDGDHPIRVDFAWPEQRIAVEADSKRFHLTQQGFENDRRRDQRLTAADWRALRTTWRQIHYAPAELEETLRTLHAR
jgi:hypothetical protein